MIKRFNRSAKFLGGLAMLVVMGCEGGTESNQNQGGDNFKAFFSGTRMYTGQSAEVNVKVRENSLYTTCIVGSNEGPADKISVYADGKKIGEYWTEAVHYNGNGFNVEQTSRRFEFSTKPGQEEAILKIIVDYADSNGTQPDRAEFNKARDLN